MTHRIDIEAAVEAAVVNLLDDPEGRDIATERDDLLAVIYAWRDETAQPPDVARVARDEETGQ